MLVWCESVNGLVVGQQYELSLWLSSWYPQNRADLAIKIDGVSIATLFAPSVTGMWQRRSFAWTATSSTAAFAAIYDNNINVGGNDFALDDIALVPFFGHHQDEFGEPTYVTDPAVVPEPSTVIAAALLLLPFGLQGFRALRNRKQPRRGL